MPATRKGMSYTVLARRYRSQTFDDVIGQEAVSRTLKNALATDRVAHAYLFTGTRGVGKTTMARILAKAMNCLSAKAPTPTPCGKCDLCQAVAEGEDIDVIEIDGASHTGVDNIRELRQNAGYKPARARFKVYIIDEVHMLSTSAFNALLKTLEEPPDHVKFIMATTEANKVPATILSRCQRFDFRNIGLDDIAGQIEKIIIDEKMQAEEGVARRVARLARGSMRDALSLLDQLMSMAEGKLTLELLADLLGTPRTERITAVAQALAANDPAQTLQELDHALNEGLAPDQLAEALQQHFRDLLVMRQCGAETDLIDVDDPKIRETFAAQAQAFDDTTLVYYITVTEELRRSLKSGAAGRPLLEAGLVRMTSVERFSDTRQLLEQLSQTGTAPMATAPASTRPITASRPTATTTPPAAHSVNASATIKINIPAAESAAWTPPSVLTLDYFRENWNDIIAQLQQRDGKHLTRYLGPAIPTAFANHQLTLGFSDADKGMRQYLTSKPDTLQEANQWLSDVLGHQINLDIEKTAVGESALPTPASTPAPRRQGFSPGAKPSAAEVNAAMNDANVRRVQDILGGKVKNVERLPGPHTAE